MTVQIIDVVYDSDYILGDTLTTGYHGVASFTPSLFGVQGQPYQRLSYLIDLVPVIHNADALFISSHPRFKYKTYNTINVRWIYWFVNSRIVHTESIEQQILDLTTNSLVTTVLSLEPQPANSVPVYTNFLGSSINSQMQDVVPISVTPLYRLGDDIAINQPNKPNYYSLLNGYELDNRLIPASINIVNPTAETQVIGFLKENIEPIPILKSIFWKEVYGAAKLNKPMMLDIAGCVLGTLKCLDPLLKVAIKSLPTLSGYYPFKYLFEDELHGLFAEWNATYNLFNSNPTNAVILPEMRELHCLAGNNNYWGNREIPTDDLNFDTEHPMYAINNQRAYDWYISPQTEGIGNLDMDSIRTIETRQYAEDIYNKAYDIHLAVGESKYSVDPVTSQPIVVNLGHLISKIAELLGYRPLPDGTFNKEQEVAKLRQIIDKNTPVDKTKVGVNNFGSDGMILKRLNNSFSGDKVTADQCVLVHDIPQLLAEYQDQLNLALGLQESSAIEIKSATSTARYQNQLQLLIELLNLVKSNHTAINAALISGLVSQGQTSELIAALGLPTVTKTIPIQIDNQINHLPYAGVAPHRSISQEIATCTANVGIVLGQLI
jgi:hypothetical protein